MIKWMKKHINTKKRKLIALIVAIIVLGVLVITIILGVRWIWALVLSFIGIGAGGFFAEKEKREKEKEEFEKKIKYLEEKNKEIDKKMEAINEKAISDESIIDRVSRTYRERNSKADKGN